MHWHIIIIIIIIHMHLCLACWSSPTSVSTFVCTEGLFIACQFPKWQMGVCGLHLWEMTDVFPVVCSSLSSWRLCEVELVQEVLRARACTSHSFTQHWMIIMNPNDNRDFDLCSHKVVRHDTYSHPRIHQSKMNSKVSFRCNFRGSLLDLYFPHLNP